MNDETINAASIPNADQVMNNRQALDAARAMGIDALDAQLLLLFALGRSPRERAWLLAHDTDTMLKDEQDQFIALLQRRAIGVPVAYLTGEKEFYGQSFSVDRRVLVPRPETELLVDWASEILGSEEGRQQAGEKPLRILDLGTGSGILAIILKQRFLQLDVTATDVCPDALTVATLNAADLLPEGATVRLCQGRWFEPVAQEKFDLVVSNPPYIAQDDSHLVALAHEPQIALVSGSDGLDDIRTIIANAGQHLNAGGWLLLEHGYDQAHAVRQLLEHAGFAQVETRKDLAGIERVTGGQWL